MGGRSGCTRAASDRARGAAGLGSTSGTGTVGVPARVDGCATSRRLRQGRVVGIVLGAVGLAVLVPIVAIVAITFLGTSARNRLDTVSPSVSAPTTTEPTTAALTQADFQRIVALTPAPTYVRRPDTGDNGAHDAAWLARTTSDPTAQAAVLTTNGFRGAYRASWVSRDRANVIVALVGDFSRDSAARTHAAEVLFATKLQNPTAADAPSSEAACVAATLTETGDATFRDLVWECHVNGRYASLVIGTKLAQPTGDTTSLLHQFVANLAG